MCLDYSSHNHNCMNKRNKTWHRKPTNISRTWTFLYFWCTCWFFPPQHWVHGPMGRVTCITTLVCDRLLCLLREYLNNLALYRQGKITCLSLNVCENILNMHKYSVIFLTENEMCIALLYLPDSSDTSGVGSSECRCSMRSQDHQKSSIKWFTNENKSLLCGNKTKLSCTFSKHHF